jgi:hypothetical protein
MLTTSLGADQAASIARATAEAEQLRAILRDRRRHTVLFGDDYAAVAKAVIAGRPAFIYYHPRYLHQSVFRYDPAEVRSFARDLGHPLTPAEEQLLAAAERAARRDAATRAAKPAADAALLRFRRAFWGTAISRLNRRELDAATTFTVRLGETGPGNTVTWAEPVTLPTREAAEKHVREHLRYARWVRWFEMNGAIWAHCWDRDPMDDFVAVAQLTWA